MADPSNDNESIMLEDAARHAYAACATAVVGVLPESGDGPTRITEDQAIGVMLGMIAAACSWAVSTSAALGKPFDRAKAEMLTAVEDHWGQAVVNLSSNQTLN